MLLFYCSNKHNLHVELNVAMSGTVKHSHPVMVTFPSLYYYFKFNFNAENVFGRIRNSHIIGHEEYRAKSNYPVISQQFLSLSIMSMDTNL